MAASPDRVRFVDVGENDVGDTATSVASSDATPARPPTLPCFVVPTLPLFVTPTLQRGGLLRAAVTGPSEDFQEDIGCHKEERDEQDVEDEVGNGREPGQDPLAAHGSRYVHGVSFRAWELTPHGSTDATGCERHGLGEAGSRRT